MRRTKKRSILEKTIRRDEKAKGEVIIAGDLNGRVGISDGIDCTVIGKHRESMRNNDDKR